MKVNVTSLADENEQRSSKDLPRHTQKDCL